MVYNKIERRVHMSLVKLAQYYEEFKDLSNEQLVEMYQKTKNDKILKHLLFLDQDIIYSLNKSYFLKRQDKEDLLQEIYFGFYEAAKIYNQKKSPIPFRPFVKQVMEYKCIDCLKRQGRQKNLVNNEAISLQLFVGVNDTVMIQDVLKSNINTFPEHVIDYKDDFHVCNDFIRKILTDLEYQTWTGIVYGFSYKEMEKLLNKSHKSVDNAFQKSKRKIIDNLKKYHITYSMFENYINYIHYHIKDYKPVACSKSRTKNAKLKIS